MKRILVVLFALSILVLPTRTSKAVIPEDMFLVIPRLQVETTLFEMEIRQRNGTAYWYISPWERRAGHLEGTALPGQTGNIVIGAHAEMVNGDPGLFARLPELITGDIIWLYEDNHLYRYAVTETKIVAFDDLSVVTHLGDRLTLITCNGEYDPEQRGYATRLVVVAEPTFSFPRTIHNGFIFQY